MGCLMLAQSVKEKKWNVADEEREALVPNVFDFLVAWKIKGSPSGIMKKTGDKNFRPLVVKKKLDSRII